MSLLDLKTGHRWAVIRCLGVPKTAALQSLTAWMVAFLWPWMEPATLPLPSPTHSAPPWVPKLCAAGVELHTIDCEKQWIIRWRSSDLPPPSFYEGTPTVYKPSYGNLLQLLKQLVLWRWWLFCSGATAVQYSNTTQLPPLFSCVSKLWHRSLLILNTMSLTRFYLPTWSFPSRSLSINAIFLALLCNPFKLPSPCTVDILACTPIYTQGYMGRLNS